MKIIYIYIIIQISNNILLVKNILIIINSYYNVIVKIIKIMLHSKINIKCYVSIYNIYYINMIYVYIHYMKLNMLAYILKMEKILKQNMKKRNYGRLFMIH